MDYSNLFQYFYRCAMVATLVENSIFFMYLFLFKPMFTTNNAIWCAKIKPEAK